MLTLAWLRLHREFEGSLSVAVLWPEFHSVSGDKATERIGRAKPDHRSDISGAGSYARTIYATIRSKVLRVQARAAQSPAE
jgi:hypothetical protein